MKAKPRSITAWTASSHTMGKTRSIPVRTTWLLCQSTVKETTASHQLHHTIQWTGWTVRESKQIKHCKANPNPARLRAKREGRIISNSFWSKVSNKILCCWSRCWWEITCSQQIVLWSLTPLLVVKRDQISLLLAKLFKRFQSRVQTGQVLEIL